MLILGLYKVNTDGMEWDGIFVCRESVEVRLGKCSFRYSDIEEILRTVMTSPIGFEIIVHSGNSQPRCQMSNVQFWQSRLGHIRKPAA